MKLADYLFENSVTPTQLRWMLGVKCRSVIWRWLINERIPRTKMMKRIEAMSGGKVTRADFLDPRSPTCARVIIDDHGEEKWLLPWSSDKAQDNSPFESPHSRLSPPVKRALQILDGRAWYTPTGKFLLDGRLSDLKRIMRAANTELNRRGAKPIPYPGVHHPEDDQ